MKKKKMVVEQQHQEDPEVLLEKIMKAEANSAERIATARKDAEKQISDIQEKAAESKKEAYASGRRARSRLVDRGLEKARAEAEEKIKQSGVEADRILNKGQEAVPEAIDISLAFILGKASKEKLS
jgi:vacuolar-type H+-ATPase subunit H